MRCAATDTERQIEASCDAVMGQPNPFSGEGYYLLDDSCLSESSVGCIGQTGCRLCHTRPASRQGESVYPLCPQCVCDKWGVSEAGACAPASCTPAGSDPFATGQEVACCAGTTADLGDHDGTGRWFYLCSSVPPPVPEAPASVPSAPAPAPAPGSAPEADTMRCAATDTERQIEASCDAVMGQPNPFSGEGYYLLDDSCLSESSVGCIGQTGCRLCHTRPASRQGESVYPLCPQCVCDKWGVSEAGACAPASCTPAGSDPFATGQEVACCAGTTADLGDHDGTGRWFYLCSSSIASAQILRASSLPRLAAACEVHEQKKECKAAFASDGCLFLGRKRHGADAGCKSLADPRTCPLIKRRKTCERSGCMWSGSCELPTVDAAGESTREGRCGSLKKKKCRQNGCLWLGRKSGGCSGMSEPAASSSCAQKRKRVCRQSGCLWLGRKNGGCSGMGEPAASSSCATKRKRACRQSGCAWLGRKNGGCSGMGSPANTSLIGE